MAGSINIKFRHAVSMIAFMLLSGACNNDIFTIDDSLINIDNDIELDGDGGCYSSYFQSDGLQRVEIMAYDSGTGSMTCYNRDGDEVSADGTVPELYRFRYISSDVTLEVVVDGSWISIESLESTATESVIVTVRLIYDRDEDIVNITLNPGQPKEFVGIVYNMDRLEQSPDVKKMTIRNHYNNESDKDWTVWVNPYSYGTHVTFDTEYPWARELAIKVPVPVLSADGAWRLSGKEYGMWTGGEYLIDTGLGDVSVSVDIPPLSKTGVDCVVSYVSASVPFDMVFRNPRSGRESMSAGICRVSYPVDYDIIIFEEK